MANNFTPVGTEVQVNTQIAGSQTDADIAVMTDGRFATVFESADNIRLQFVTAGGVRDGAVVNVESDAGSQINPVVTQFGAGAIVIWHDVASSDEIHYQTVSSAGGLGAETLLLGGTALSLPDAATLDDGRVLVVANRLNADQNIVFRFIESNGVVGGADFIDNGAGIQTDAAVATFGNNALVVYNDESTAPGSIVARFYDGVGETAADFAAEVAISTGGNPQDPDVAALTDGRFIVVWDDSVTDDIQGRLVDATGAPIGAVFTISNAPGNNDDPRVAALPDGGFIVTFENNGGLFPTEDASNDAIVARRYDKNGNPAGDLFLVNTGDPLTAQTNPAIAVNTATGEAFIAWDDNHVFTAPDDNSAPGVRGRAFQTEADPINGTDGKDVLQGLGIAEVLNGLKGKDTINAGDGDDLLNGGKDSDKLNGEAGVDTFLFDSKKGADRLDWVDGEILQFDTDVFKPGKLGVLKGKYFNKDASADDGNDYFNYQKNKGKLYYDSNGNDPGKSELIAKLDKGSDLDADEIFMV